MNICEQVNKVCPSTKEIYESLLDKKRIANQIYHNTDAYRKRRTVIDVVPAFKYAQNIYGKLQRADLSIDPPDFRIIMKAIVYSVPGLFACLHARYYCERGLLNNKFISITGSGGMGKSTFSILLANIMDGYVFTKEDDVLKGVMGLLTKSTWTPVIVFDDIAAIISKYWYMSKKERAWKNFFKMIEYLKDIAGITLITSRSLEGEAKRFRELTELTGKIERFYYGGYIVDVIQWKEGSRYQTTIDYVDVLWPGLRIPDHIWNRMMMRRKLRSQILVLETILELADNGEIHLSEEEREKIEQQIAGLREKLNKV